MKYYTVTADYKPTEGGNSHAILIMRGSSEGSVLEVFQNFFGFNAAQKADIREDIHIENGFNDLLTDQAKKTLVKIKSKSPSAPSEFSYMNKTYVNYVD